MKTIKTADAIDPALDWLVATCEGRTVELAAGYVYMFNDPHPYTPSTDWAEGGPIIERERIRLDCAWSDEWTAQNPYNAKIDGYTGWTKGTTALIAAMRCFVASKMGDEVEVPEELT